MNNPNTSLSYRIAISALGIGIIGILAFLALRETYQKKLIPVSQPSSASSLQIMPRSQIQEGLFYFREGNFAFEPLSLWAKVDSATVNSPGDFGTSLFVFTRPGTNCALSFIRASEKDFRRYKQSSFATRVFTDRGYQLDSDWWLNASTSLSFAFYGNIRHPLPGEIRIVRYHLNGTYDANFFRAFLLFATDGGTVSDQCDTEFSEMLKTLRPMYDEVADLRGKNGSFSLGSVYGETKGKNSTTYLFFHSDVDPVLQKVMPLSGYRVTVYDDRLYSIHDSRILVSDPFTRTEEAVGDPASLAGGEISDFFIAGESIYYLAGSGCEGPGTCDLQLFKIPRRGGRQILLGDHIKGSKLLGYSPEENSAYVWGGYGDAGCFSGRLYRYDLATKAPQLLQQYSGCESDNPAIFQTAVNAIDSVETRFSRSVPEVRLEDGHLRPVEDKVPINGAVSPFRFISR